MDEMSKAPPKTKPRAFALLHFASFLALCTLAAAIAIPAWFRQGDVTLERAAILFARDLRAVQNHAVISGQRIRIEFLPAGDGYRALDASGNPVILYHDGVPLVRAYNTDGIFDGVRVHSVSLDGDRPLAYDPSGFAQSGGEIVLSQGEERMLIHIDPKSGWISIDGLSKPWRDTER